MRRLIPALGAAVALSAGAVASAASAATTKAKTVQIGVGGTKIVAPVCAKGDDADHCRIVLSKKTAYSITRLGVGSAAVVKANGQITKFTVGVSILSTNKAKQTQYLNNLSSSTKGYGGPPEAQLTVLAVVGNPALRRYRVVANSPTYTLTKYLGKVPVFTLTTPIPVVRGEIIAFTTPTWAPVLSYDLSTSLNLYAESHSNSNGCNPQTSTNPINPYFYLNFAQTQIGDVTGYGCTYTGGRIQYSATEVESTS